ncbi:MAG: DNA recombination protein RmuC [Deltaproteobacteria bacterium]|nr:DNA recombination protein RmuC [Deltaproteobacteria bacterium]
MMLGVGIALGLALGWLWGKLQAATVVANLRSEAARLQAEAQAGKVLQEEIQNIRAQNKLEFENLAHTLMNTQGKALADQHTQGLKTLLDTYQSRIKVFEERVEKNTEGASVLRGQIDELVKLNRQLSTGAENLVLALKGDRKSQGNWGELGLERILEASGLRKDLDYQTQVSVEGESGGQQYLDVRVLLPEDRHVVIDAKVSLTNYEAFKSASDEKERAKQLSLHVESVWNHVKDLSDKHYSRAKGVNSPDFVFMYLPLEPAYLEAVAADRELVIRAWEKKVAVVTSTTLFASLRTVASIWKVENQNKNAIQIAEEGARLYDKFVGLLEDFADIRRALDGGIRGHDSALTKIQGKGGIASKVENLKTLGANPKKSLDAKYLE